MPYKSDAQRRYFHWAQGKGLIPKKTVEEYDDASKGKNLPERINPKRLVKYTKDKKMRKEAGGYLAATKNIPKNVMSLIKSLKGAKNISSHAKRFGMNTGKLLDRAGRAQAERAMQIAKGLVVPAGTATGGALAYKALKKKENKGLSKKAAFMFNENRGIY